MPRLKFWLLRSALLLAVGNATLSATSLAEAAQVTSRQTAEGTVVRLEGEIAKGDFDELAYLFLIARDAGRRACVLELNSDGGDAKEAAHIATLVRYHRAATAVLEGDTCAFDCLVAFNAGPRKYVGFSARLGIPRLKMNDDPSIRDMLAKKYRLPRSAIGRFTASGEAGWLSPSELRAMGVKSGAAEPCEDRISDASDRGHFTAIVSAPARDRY
jgi:hypothetical protein